MPALPQAMEDPHNFSASLQEAPASVRFPHACLAGGASSACAAIACRLRSARKHDDNNEDDGSVARKLLPTIAKSLSSPSLLSCCDEPVRETSYQKALRLSTMKLQHCAEELGSESSDSSSTFIDSFDLMSPWSSTAGNSVITRCNSLPSPSCISPPSMPQKDQLAQCNPIPLIVSVRSAPNLGCPLKRRERSFPPPLAYTLPRSASADAFTFALRPCREDGRFMLKEVKVPCRQYLHASRHNGRLTLQLFTADEGAELRTERQQDCADLQEDDSNMMDDAASHGERMEEAYYDYKEGGADKVSMPSLKNTQESSTEWGIVTDEDQNRGPSAKGFVTLQAFASDKGFMVDEALCSDAFCTTISICKTNQCSASKGSLARSAARSNGTAAPCSSHNSSMLQVSPVLLMARSKDNTVCQRKASRRTSGGMREGKTMRMESSFAIGLRRPALRTSTLIFKDLSHTSLVAEVAKLVNSLGLKGAKCWEGRIQPRERGREQSLVSIDQDSSTMADDGIRSIKIAVKKLNKCTEEPCSIHILNLPRKRRPQLANASEENCGKLIHDFSVIKSTATIRVHVQLPLNLDWLQSSHNCKEPFDRNFVSKVIPCLAIRS